MSDPAVSTALVSDDGNCWVEVLGVSKSVHPKSFYNLSGTPFALLRNSFLL